MSSFTMLLCALATYLTIYYRTKDASSPGGLLCLFWFLAASIADISTFREPILQPEWDIETYGSIYIAGFAMFISGLLQKKAHNQLSTYPQPQLIYRQTTYLLMLLSIIAVILRYHKTGFSLSQVIINYGVLDLKSNIPDAVPFFNYFEILTPYLSLAGIFELSTSGKTKKHRSIILKLYIFYSTFIYCTVLAVSRGSLLIIITGSLYLYSRKNNITLLRIGLSALTIASLMSFLSFVRLSAASITNTYLGEGIIMKIFSPIYTYVAFNFDNFNKLVQSNTEPTYIFYALKFLIWPFYKSDYESGQIKLVDFDTLFFNARTFLYPFYHDLGLVGCFIYPSIISLITTKLYNTSQRKNEMILPLMCMQKAIWFTFFGNYFFGETVIFAPLAVTLILGFLYYGSKPIYSTSKNRFNKS